MERKRTYSPSLHHNCWKTSIIEGSPLVFNCIIHKLSRNNVPTHCIIKDHCKWKPHPDRKKYLRYMYKYNFNPFHCLEYLMMHGGRVVTVDIEAPINHVVPLLSSSETAQYHCKFHYLILKKCFRQKAEDLLAKKCCLCPLWQSKSHMFRWSTSWIIILSNSSGSVHHQLFACKIKRQSYKEIVMYI